MKSIFAGTCTWVENIIREVVADSTYEKVIDRDGMRLLRKKRLHNENAMGEINPPENAEQASPTGSC